MQHLTNDIQRRWCERFEERLRSTHGPNNLFELAEVMGKEPASYRVTLSNWKNGKVCPSLANAERVAIGLGFRNLVKMLGEK